MRIRLTRKAYINFYGTCPITGGEVKLCASSIARIWGVTKEYDCCTLIVTKRKPTTHLKVYELYLKRQYYNPWQSFRVWPKGFTGSIWAETSGAMQAWHTLGYRYVRVERRECQ